MAYTLEQLGEFLQVGPQVYPDRPPAVQVIMRGPHGMRIAQDPVVTKSAPGFKFWVDDMNFSPGEKWIPAQKVMGLMGAGDLLVPTDADKQRLTGLSKQAYDAALTAIGRPGFHNSELRAGAFTVPQAKAIVLTVRQELGKYQRYESWNDYNPLGSYKSSEWILNLLNAASNLLGRAEGRVSPTAIDESGSAVPAKGFVQSYIEEPNKVDWSNLDEALGKLLKVATVGIGVVVGVQALSIGVELLRARNRK